MSLDLEQIRQHCKVILNSRRIFNKIVVLCEGEIKSLQGRQSPQMYRQMERMPDSNFYKASIPRWWTERLPQFFNCGDRNDVLNTYFTLLELHEEGIDSYLNPTKLFAFVDLDIQPKKIEHSYLFSDTEEIFFNLYNKTKTNEVNACQHRVWVTGLIHKEAYFLVPGLQSVFDQFSVQAVYGGRSLLLEDIYLVMASDISSDADLQNNFQRVCARINYCAELDLTEATKLEDSWKLEFQSTEDATRKDELIFNLLTIRKAKGYWHQIEPSSEWTRSSSTFREQLSLEIGRFYSEQVDIAQYHIPSFFKVLYQFV